METIAKGLSQKWVSLIAWVTVALISVLVFLTEKNKLVALYDSASEQALVAHANFFNLFFARSADAAYFISQNKALIQAVQANDFSTEAVSTLFESTMASRPEFIQLRYIDSTGQERIRLDRDRPNQAFYRIDDAQLQNKSSRYYFTETMNAPTGVYWSKSDLNVERGQVEVPHKPVKRFGVRIESQGQPQGMLIANIGLKYLIQHFELNMQGQSFYIVDDDKEIIWDSENKASWGRSLGSPQTFDHTDSEKGIYEKGGYVQKVELRDEANPLRHTYYTLVWDRRNEIQQEFLELTALYLFVFLTAMLLMQIMIIRYFKIHRTLGETSMKLSHSEKQLMMQSKHAAMGEMMTMIAHQWKQPLGVTTSNISVIEMLMENGEFKPEDKKVIDELFEVTNLMLDEQAKTIKDFQEYLKPNKDKSLFDVSDVISASKAMMKPLLDKKSVLLTVDVEPVQMWGRARELQQILVNLIKNAIDQHEINQTVDAQIHLTVEVVSDIERVHLRVKDNAGGIAPEILSNLFTRYTTSKSDSDGTGLGLYMTKMILEEQFYGTVEARNEQEGAVFEISMPILKPDSER